MKENALALALNIPKEYHNLYLLKAPLLGANNALHLRLEAIRHSKILTIQAYCYNYDTYIELVFFNAIYYHKKRFSALSECYIYGKVENKFDRLQVVQPKIIQEVNTIVPRYKSDKRVQSHTIHKAIQAHVTLSSLMSEGLPQNIAQRMIAIHNPTLEFLRNFQGEFRGAFLETIKFVEIFAHLKALSKKRRDFPALTTLTSDPTPFIDALPFRLTSEQAKVIAQIQSDLAKDIASKRVIVGDVGSGKTVVILASVVMAYPKRSVIMAPTSVLANQLYDEAQKLLPKKLSITLITASTKGQNLEADLLIGTHALLYKELSDISLVIVDELHKFGTKHRNTLEKMLQQDTHRPHFLQFSATPIPRTMALIESSLVDISMIKSTPFAKDITTTIIDKAHFNALFEHIESEVAKQNQVLIIYPLVEESEHHNYKSLEESKAFWQERFEDVYVTSGKDKNKESVLREFKEHGTILLATTVVEVGISLPKLSTIVIVGAEKLGLASLHQLRGRVSRNGLKGYCFLYTLTPQNKRLKAFSQTLSGFEISELDLHFRNSGDILDGKVQSGKSFQWIDLSHDEAIIQHAKEALKEIQ